MSAVTVCGNVGPTMDTPTFDTYDPELAAHLLDPGHGLQDGIAGYLGIRIVDVGPGRATGEVQVRDELVHQYGALHGGVVATLVDQVLGSAIYPVVPPGTWPATLEFKLNYLAPVRSGVVRADSRVVGLTSRTAVVHVDVTNGDRSVAVALGTISLNPPKPG
jgi:1,4-dihydroxy-2-naphthoyl-CoA hydrolase